ncbi:MAG: type II toxin-antitoxin system HicA family toxin [Chloroflexi bacterium]|nr:MAG: type II toxin-antitoxin system HicA family toxin [Chloroflexota bacterium]
MSKLPIISGQECVRALQRLGYTISRQKGSHIRMRHESRPPVTVPDHNELDRGTLRAIIRQAKLSVDEFVDML